MSDYCIRFVSFFLKLFHIRVNKEKEHLLVQIVNFCIVGGMATLIDFAFLYIFRDIFKFGLIFSNSLSFALSVIFNYYASIKYVFDVKKDKKNSKYFALFILFSIIGLGLNNILLWIFTNAFNIYYMISKAIATIFVMVFNFVTRKKFLE